MPGDYQCANCHQLVCVDVGLYGVIFPEGGGPEERVRVRCPHCGAENTYRVPAQAPEEYEDADREQRTHNASPARGIESPTG